MRENKYKLQHKILGEIIKNYNSTVERYQKEQLKQADERQPIETWEFGLSVYELSKNLNISKDHIYPQTEVLKGDKLIQPGKSPGDATYYVVTEAGRKNYYGEELLDIKKEKKEKSVAYILSIASFVISIGVIVYNIYSDDKVRDLKKKVSKIETYITIQNALNQTKLEIEKAALAKREKSEVKSNIVIDAPKIVHPVDSSYTPETRR